MANIGNFTRDGDSFTGAINTLALRAKASFRPIAKTNAQAPDYVVYASGALIGAAWKKTSKDEQRAYLSVKLDDPSFPAAIHCRLVEGQDGAHQLQWSR